MGEPNQSNGTRVERTHQLTADLVTLVGGKDHICALDAAGAVWCWGENDKGQVGSGSTRSDTPRRVPLPPAQDLAAGYKSSCALVDGAPFCWGEVEQDAPPLSPRNVEVPVRSGGIAVTMNTLAVVAADDDAAHFYDGGCANGRRCVDPTKSRATVLGRVQEIQLAALFACALELDGNVACWTSGRPPSHIERPAFAGRHAERLATLEGGACAIMDDASLRCWGNVPRDLDEPHEGIRAIPWDAPRVVPLQGEKIRDIAATSYGLCAAWESGGLTCWGHDLVRGRVP